jgi:RND family efflux transporter MFP subunit
LLVASGYIIARREAQVGAKVSGRLAWLGVEAGSIVKEGDVIGRLEDADLRAELDLAKAQLERAEKLVGRYLAARTGTTENDIDAASAELKVARARVAEAEARLADTVIRAPFAGVVVEKRAEVGETVSPLATTNQLTPTGIARLVDFATLEAEVDVSERFVKKLAEGQPAVIEIAAFPGRRFRGELRQIIPTSSREKAIVEVRVAFVERDATILPNMGAKVTFYERGER